MQALHLRSLLLATTLLAGSAGSALAQADTEARFLAAFDLADRRAREVVQAIRCEGLLTSMRVAGMFGPADSLGSVGFCSSAGGRAIGVVLQPNDEATRAERFTAVDLVSEERVRAAVDTASFLARAYATRDAIRRAADAFVAAQRPFGPVTILAPGDSIEVWILPLAVLGGADEVAVGGERGFIYSPDGRTLVREMDAFDRYRVLALSDTVEIVIESADPETPLLTELLFASLLAEVDEVVTIHTRSHRSILVGSGAESLWMHVRRDGGGA